MSIESVDFLSAAEEMIKSNNDEINIRNSISRSYYSIYHKILSAVKSVPRPENYGGTSSSGVHKALIEYLEGDAHKDLSLDKKSLCKLAHSLKWTKRLREDADYFLGQNITKLKATQIIGEAHKVIGNVDTLLKEKDEEVVIEE